MVRCGCGAMLPEESGPRHPYLTATPACWRRFGEVQVRLLETGHRTSVVTDAYAAQHADNADTERRQRQSVAVHLVALCLHLVHGVPDEALLRLRGRVSTSVLPTLGADDWPALVPPTAWGPLNAAALFEMPDDQLGQAVDQWPQQVWRAWSAYEGLVQEWTAVLLDGDRR